MYLILKEPLIFPGGNNKVRGALPLRVGDLLMVSDNVFQKEIIGRLPKDFRAGPENENDCRFAGQRIEWKKNQTHGWCLNVHQRGAIDELQETLL